MRKTLANSNASRTAAGFTLAELLVVLVLIGLACAVVLPFAARSFGNFKLRLAEDSLRTLFKEARSRARFEGRSEAVVFLPPDRAGRQLLLVREDGRRIDGVTLPAEISVAVKNADGAWSENPQPIHFFPNGTCEATELDLSNSRAKHLQLELAPLVGSTREVDPENGNR
jgi:prepilin-type N-terminal cleavage/methylation domain-containing protein